MNGPTPSAVPTTSASATAITARNAARSPARRRTHANKKMNVYGSETRRSPKARTIAETTATDTAMAIRSTGVAGFETNGSGADNHVRTSGPTISDPAASPPNHVSQTVA